VGGNDPTNTQYYNTDDPSSPHGATSTTGVACYSDGQIRTPTPNYYRASSSPSRHDCSEKSTTCANPGSSICTPSKQQCTIEEQGCYTSVTECEKENTCNEESGWTKNIDKTDCNIFKCTKDGSFLDRSAPSGKPGSKTLIFCLIT
jgi:hypothetical protein